MSTLAPRFCYFATPNINDNFCSIWSYNLMKTLKLPSRFNNFFALFERTGKENSTCPAPCVSESCIKIKINLNFYFHTSLWYLKRFYEGL